MATPQDGNPEYDYPTPTTTLEDVKAFARKMASAYTKEGNENACSEFMPLDGLESFRATVASSLGTGCHLMASLLVLATSLAFALNEMETGDKAKASKQSQLELTYLYTVLQLSSVVSSVLALTTGWLGTLKVMKFCILPGVVACLLALAANVAKVKVLYVPAMICMGISNTLHILGPSFLANVIVIQDIWKFSDMRATVESFLIFFGCLLNIPLAEAPAASYVVAALFLLIGFRCYTKLFDLSPRVDLRRTPSLAGILKLLFLGPCVLLHVLCSQTLFTLTLLCFFVMCHAYFASTMAWQVNYLLMNFDLNSPTISAILLVFTLLFLVAMLKTKKLFINISSKAMVLSAVALLVACSISVLASDNLPGLLFGMSVNVIAAPLISMGAVILSGQKSPGKRHTVIALYKLFSGLFSGLAVLIGGEWCALWLDQKESADGLVNRAFPSFPWGLPPTWSSLPWVVLAFFFILLSCLFRKQDKKFRGTEDGINIITWLDHVDYTAEKIKVSSTQTIPGVQNFGTPGKPLYV